jgi:hypothetical protein
VGSLLQRFRRTVRVFGSVFANPDLRRVLLAYSTFGMAEWGTWMAILVFAFRRGGAAEAGLVAVIQMTPAALVAPLASVLGDRFRRERVLAFGYLVQTAAMGGTAAALFGGVPVAAVYALAACTATSITLTRPVQSALLPQLARTPAELTAANAAVATVRSAVALAGPALTGLLLGIGGASLVFAVFGAGVLGSATLAFLLPFRPSPERALGHPMRAAAAGFRAVFRQPDQRLVVSLLAGQRIIEGAVDVLLVVVVLDLLGLGASSVGYLGAVLGAGGLVGGTLALRVVGPFRLAPPLAAGLAIYGVGVGAVALGGQAVMVGGFLLVGGLGYVLADVAGRTLLQRVVRDQVLARVFGILEGVQMAAFAVGSGVAPLLVRAFGIRGGIVAVGALLPAVTLLSWRRVMAVDRAAPAPVAEVALLRSIELFAPLLQPTIEGIASRLVPVDAMPGRPVVREGDAGDRFYVVAEGEVEVTRKGVAVASLGRGDYFGEIALLHDVPRTATVTPSIPSRLLALERHDFLEAITGHPTSRGAAERVAASRLPTAQGRTASTEA